MTDDALGAAWTPVPILMYHAVEPRERAPEYKHFYVTVKEFERQIRELRSRGYQAISLDQLASARVNGAAQASLPTKPIVLTFDDGYQNLFANVHPLLMEVGWPYTVYLVSQCIGKTNQWDEAKGFEAKPLLDGDQIVEMKRYAGVSFGAHTRTHPELNALDPEQLRTEIAVGKVELEQQLQSAVRHFCYPYGIYNDVAVKAVKDAGFATATTTNFGRVRRNDDDLLLPRVSIYHVPPFSLTYGPGALNFRWRVETRKDKRPEPS